MSRERINEIKKKLWSSWIEDRGDKRNVISGDLLCDVEWLLKEVELFTKGKK